MASRIRKHNWAVLAGVIGVLILLLWNPAANALFSVRLGRGILNVATGESGRELPVKEAVLQRRSNGRDYKALVYYSANSKPRTAAVFVAGLSELGCYHPRVRAMARLLADRGLLVITPDIQEFRDFQISAAPIEQILFWYRLAPELPEGKSVRKTGLAGVSFSGTLALMAAARPEIRDSVGFVAAIGPYSSLMRCARSWFAAAPGPAGAYYPTRFYAKWIIMRSALGILPESKERKFLQEVLNNLLLQKKVSDPYPGLSPRAERWYQLATMSENQTDLDLTAEIESYMVSRLYPQLDPEKALKEIRCPVFLIHGAYDDLIPAEESMELNQRLPGSRLLISPFLTHTHPAAKPLSSTQKFKAASDTLLFFYRCAQAVR